MKRWLLIATLFCGIASAQPSTSYELASPQDTVSMDNHTYYLDASNFSTDFWEAVNEADATKGRVYLDDSLVRCGVDWVDFVDNGSTGTGEIYFLYPGATGTTPDDVRIYFPDSGNSSVAAGDAYGQYAAYRADVEGFWPDGAGNDRTGNALHLSSTDITPGDSIGQIGNATEYNGTSSRADALIAISEPVTLLGWMKSDTNSVTLTLSGWGDKDTPDDQHRILWIAEEIQVDSFDGLTRPFSLKALEDPTIWNHIVGVWETNSKRTAYVNGSGGTPETTTTVATGEDRITLGVSPDSTPSGWMDGLISNTWAFSSVVLLPEVEANYLQGADNGSYYTLTWVPVAEGGGLLLLEGLFVR